MELSAELSDWQICTQAKVLIGSIDQIPNEAVLGSRLQAVAGKLVGNQVQIRRMLQVEPALRPESLGARILLLRLLEESGATVFASLAHTGKWCAAAVIPDSKNVRGLGIDIEQVGRMVSKRLSERIDKLVPKSDEEFLVRWVRYESAYKASFGSDELSNSAPGEFSAPLSRIQTEVRLWNGLLVGIAVSRPEDR